MSEAETLELINSGAKILKFDNGDASLEGNQVVQVHVASFPANKIIEDTWCAKSVSGRSGIFGVFDALTKAFERLDSDLQQLPFKAIPNLADLSRIEISSLPKKTLVNATKMIIPAITGSCALVARVAGDDLHVANAGDCRAVLGSRIEGSGGVGYVAKDLSTDHQAGTPSELARLRKEHPGEEKTVAFQHSGERGVYRVLGGLMPSRAFGDSKYKWPVSLSKKVDSINKNWERQVPTLKNCLTPPYITASPEVTHRVLEPSDEFVILASDGLYERLTSQQAVDAVGSLLSTQFSSPSKSNQNSEVSPTWPPWSSTNDAAESQTPLSRAEATVDTHILKTDNLLNPHPDGNLAVSLLRAAFLSPNVRRLDAKLLMCMRPGGEARGFRDDITILVLVFRGKGKGKGERSGVVGKKVEEVQENGAVLQLPHDATVEG
ncbi:[Pyruvate dehydrogenase [acetyl-transferring]]-phosphatase 1, mitochondrial [Blyttiomyces sp. JEL0837]|nr:[Pyruvate dehydrogenase [acetyl-transferring]]-phosphatase 1, mitochondrial [Blyttiomyces sp. JEL0837]